MLGSLISFFSSGVIIFFTPKNPSHLKFKKEDHRNLGYPISYYEGEGLTQEMVQHRICVMYSGAKFLFPRVVPLVPTPSVPTVPRGQVILSRPVRSIIDSDFLDVKKGERSNHFKVAETTEGQSVKVKFTRENIKTFNELSLKYHSSEMAVEELILELRAGGELENWIAKFGIGLAIIVIIKNANSFQPNLPGRIIVPPHLQWLYDTYKPGQDFGYGKSSGPASITASSATQNSGDFQPESAGSYDYIETMRELKRQQNKKTLEIQVGSEIYRLQNSFRENAEELQFKLAEKMYDSIRECDTDICDIAANLDFKADNIKNVKGHVFYNEHDLDRYGPDEIEHKRFDATLEQALAWKRLEMGTHTQEDITWIKHECSERHHELKYGSGYSEAHNRAQSRYDGYPWENKF